MEDVKIRPATADDCDRIMELINELAVYEKMPDGPKIDADVLRRDGFGPDKYYQCLVAEIANPDVGVGGKLIVGYGLYFFVYSTWEGRSLWLEDFYVTPLYRSKGIGSKIWMNVAKAAVQRDCSRMNFAVLGWNKPAIDFYRSQGAVDLTEGEEWHMYRLRRAELEKVAQRA
ncbi:hypothetical protein ScPMuIL_018108 [Solemya velum]